MRRRLLLAVGRNGDRESAALQVVSNDFGNVGLIFDHQGVQTVRWSDHRHMEVVDDVAILGHAPMVAVVYTIIQPRGHS